MVSDLLDKIDTLTRLSLSMDVIPIGINLGYLEYYKLAQTMKAALLSDSISDEQKTRIVEDSRYGKLRYGALAVYAVAVPNRVELVYENDSDALKVYGQTQLADRIYMENNPKIIPFKKR